MKAKTKGNKYNQAKLKRKQTQANTVQMCLTDNQKKATTHTHHKNMQHQTQTTMASIALHPLHDYSLFTSSYRGVVPQSACSGSSACNHKYHVSRIITQCNLQLQLDQGPSRHPQRLPISYQLPQFWRGRSLSGLAFVLMSANQNVSTDHTCHHILEISKARDSTKIENVNYPI